MRFWQVVLRLIGCSLAFYVGAVSAKPFKGAEIITRETFRYGAFEARIKASEGSGQIMAFFLWKHDSEVPGVGWQEQDFEVFGKNGNFQSQLMTPGLNGDERTEQGIYHTLPEKAYDDYHTYRMEWTPTYLAFYYDGVLIRYEDGTKEPGKTTYKQFFEDADAAQLRINMWAGDWHWSGLFDESALPGAIFVEYCEVYNYTPGSGASNSDFSLRWRDDFNTISSNRWWFANWTFSYAVNDYTSQNARAIDGKLVMVLTDDAHVGTFPTQIPQDDGIITQYIEPLPHYDPVVIPARLEAEHVSAYQDFSPINFGDPECGRSGVDAELTGDSDGYCNIGWVQAGEWTEYKIVAPVEGAYELVFRAATGKPDVYFHLEIDGVIVPGGIGVPQGQWDSYNNLTANVHLTEGQHTLRIVYDTGEINLNYIQINEADDAPLPVDPSQPVTLPALIQAENYSGYYDRTVGNQGHSSCGADDVDMEITSDTSGGCNIGWVQAGEWTEYKIFAANNGAYEFMLRLATTKAGVSVHLEIDGVDVSGPIYVPQGASWHAYNNFTETVNLTQGQHTLRVVFDTGNINFNYVDIKVSDETPDPEDPEDPPVEPSERFTVPALIQAEYFHSNYDKSPGNLGTALCGEGDVDMEITGDLSGGCNIGWVEAGEWTEYNILVPEAGTYDVILRAATAKTGVRVHIEVDGIYAAGPLSIPKIAWHSYTNVIGTTYLSAGPHQLRIVFDTGNINLNYIEILKSDVEIEPEEPSGPITLPARIEAEEYSAYYDSTVQNRGEASCAPGGVDMEFTGDIDGGCNIGWVVAGEWVEFLVTSPQDDVYNLTARLASNRIGNRVTISVDGNQIGTLDVPGNGWQTYSDIPLSLPLTSGQHTIRVTFDTGNANLNYLNITN
jgi:hypothetical protein